jgi:O-antigen/teichoic acid export membrane protein
MNSGNKISKNAFILYGRMFISLIIGLLSTRIVLNALSVEDYGIFNLIVGVVTMISFLNSAMAGTIQRFLFYNLGAGDGSKLKI